VGIKSSRQPVRSHDGTPFGPRHPPPHHSEARATVRTPPRTPTHPPDRVPHVMDPSTSAAAAQAAGDEELRGECAKAFAHYKNGNLKVGTDLLQKLLARHPAHPLLHFAYMRLAHMQLLLEQRLPLSIMKLMDECGNRATAARKACPESLLLYLLVAQMFYDFPAPTHQDLDAGLDALRTVTAAAAASPLKTADLEYAKAIATFDEEVFTLALLPDVRECADPDAYRSQALACLATAPAKIVDLHRQAESLARNTPGQSEMDHFIVLRDSEHAAEAARRLLRAEAAQALAAVHRVMAGKGTAHDLQEAAAGWRESADQGDASAQLLIGALLARGGGGVKRSQPVGKRYLELSAAAGNEAASTLLKELRKCVGCGELDVHHMICSQCRDARYCDDDCQLRHWQCPTHPHKPHCVRRREAATGAGAQGGSSEQTTAVPPDPVTAAPPYPVTAAEAVRVAGNDLFREHKYPEMRPGVKRLDPSHNIDSLTFIVSVRRNTRNDVVDAGSSAL